MISCGTTSKMTSKKSRPNCRAIFRNSSKRGFSIVRHPPPIDRGNGATRLRSRPLAGLFGFRRRLTFASRAAPTGQLFGGSFELLNTLAKTSSDFRKFPCTEHQKCQGQYNEELRYTNAVHASPPSPWPTIPPCPPIVLI